MQVSKIGFYSNNLTSLCKKEDVSLRSETRPIGEGQTLLENSNAVYSPYFTAIARKIPTKLQRFEGCLLGGAIGDAFGASLEFLDIKKIKKLFGEQGATFKTLAGTALISEITDDTQMTFYTADGLIKSAISNSSIQDVDFGYVFDSYQDWLKAQEQQPQHHKGWINKIEAMKELRAPGNTCITAISSGVPGRLSSKINDSKGNGGVMRVAPVGLMYHRAPQKAFDIGMGCTMLTHGNPDAYLSAGMFASMIAFLTKGATVEKAFRESMAILKTKRDNEEIVQKLNFAHDLAKSHIASEEAISYLGQGWIGSEALGIALYCTLKNPRSIRKAIEMAANITGDSDTVAAITGNLMGAHIGSNNIPLSLAANIRDRFSIKELAKDLYTTPAKIVHKEQKYPVEYKVMQYIPLKEILEERAKKTEKKYNYELINKIKNLAAPKIYSWEDYLESTTLPANTARDSITPIKLIAEEIENVSSLTKMLQSVSENFDKLVHKENSRYCWAEDRATLPDVLWELFDTALNNKNVSKHFEIITIMSEAGNFNFNQMLELVVKNKNATEENLVLIIKNLFKEKA